MVTNFGTLRSNARQLWILLAVASFLVGLGTTVAAEQRDEIARLKERMIPMRQQSKWLEGMPLAERLVKLTVDAYGENHPETAEALHFWAWFVQENGDYDKAEELWRRALAIDEAVFGKDTVQTTRRLHLLGNLYRDRAQHAKAKPLLLRALAIREKHLGPDHVETAQVVRSLGILCSYSGDYAAAEGYLSRALRIYETAGPGVAGKTGTLAAMGWLYLAVGDYERAQSMLERSLAASKRLLGLENAWTADCLRALAQFHIVSRDFAKAIAFDQQSLAIREKLFGTNHISLFHSLLELGSSFLAQGDFRNAEAMLHRARAVLEQNLGPAHPRVASVLMTLSRLEETRGQYALASSLCQEAHALRKRHLGASHHSTIASLRQLVALDAALGRPQRAFEVADTLQQAEETFLANILSFTSERQRLLSQNNTDVLRHRYDLWANTAAVKPLARAILRTKGVVLDSIIEDRLLAESSDDTEVQTLVRQITQARSRLAARDLCATNPSQALNSSSEIESLEALLARRVTGLGFARRALSADLEHVLAVLPKNAVLLEMLRYRRYLGQARSEDSYGVLVLSGERELRWVHLGAAESIEKAIKQYQHAVRTPSASEALVQALHDLYRQVWLPLRAELPADTKQIIISPDGELNFISFAGLLTPADRFLGEDYLFSYVSSGRDLLASVKPPVASGSLLIWANPDFDLLNATSTTETTGTPGFRNLTLSPLPGAEEEGRVLCRRATELGFDSAVLRTGTNATEGELHRIHAPRVLHLATHAFVLPQLEPLPFAADEHPESAVLKSAPHNLNPMLRCGLALAGARRTVRNWADGQFIAADDDGIITADQIGGLDLRGTWLVVLSACDSGIGEARAGEGVLGLRRGFIQAGAQNLLLTLWPVDDAQTARFMPEFYSHMRKTVSPSQSLAETQRTWLQKLRAEQGVAAACRIAGPFILNFQGKPD